jgi:hypothetical protein
MIKTKALSLILSILETNGYFFAVFVCFVVFLILRFPAGLKGNRLIQFVDFILLARVELR